MYLTQESTRESIVYGYSRRQALVDGLLVDITKLAHEMGIVRSVAVTRAVHELVGGSDSESEGGQSPDGQLWDILWMLRLKALGAQGPMILFDVTLNTGFGHRLVRLKAAYSPGDDGEPVLTIMLPDED